MKVELLTPPAWFNQMLELVEFAARVSHNSVGKMSETAEERQQFLRKLLRVGHWSVFEHAYFSVMFDDVSRGLTHELVRHRLCAYTQQSTRFVRPAEIRVITTQDVEDKEELERQLADIYHKVRGLPRDVARQFLPIGIPTKIVMTANWRVWHHILEVRTERHAHQEIREAMLQVLRLVQPLAQPVFDDIKVAAQAATTSGEYPPA